MDPYEATALRHRRPRFFQWFGGCLNHLGILWPKYYAITTYPQADEQLPVEEIPVIVRVLPGKTEDSLVDVQSRYYPEVLRRKSQNRWVRIELHRRNRQKFGRRLHR